MIICILIYLINPKTQMEKLDFVSSFIDDKQQYKTWNPYAKCIYAIDSKQSVNSDFIYVTCNSIYKFNKYTYSIKSIIDNIRTLTDTFILLNSDIELDNNPSLWQKIVDASDDAVIIGHRFNYTNSYADGILNLNGIDFVLINKKLNIPDDHNFCLGLCSWDWWIPYLAMTQNIPVLAITQPFLFHKNHPRRWSDESCSHMMKYFRSISGHADNRFKQYMQNNIKLI